MKTKPSKKLALTCGDPAGVGPEVLAAWLAAHPDEAGDVAVLGPKPWLETLGPAVGKIAVGPPDFLAKPGEPTRDGACVALAAMERAARRGLGSCTCLNCNRENR